MNTRDSYNFGSELVFASITGGLTYAATALLTTHDPAVGFLAGFTFRIFDGAVNTESNNLIKSIFAVFLSAGVAKIICESLGVALTYKTALILTGLSVASAITVLVVAAAVGALAVGAYLCCGCCLNTAFTNQQSN